MSDSPTESGHASALCRLYLALDACPVARRVALSLVLEKGKLTTAEVVVDDLWVAAAVRGSTVGELFDKLAAEVTRLSSNWETRKDHEQKATHVDAPAQEPSRDEEAQHPVPRKRSKASPSKGPAVAAKAPRAPRARKPGGA